MAHIVVFGGSSGTGREVVKAALDAGHHVRAFSRSAENTRQGGKTFQAMNGDATVADDSDKALEGVDGVVQALGIPTGDFFRPVTLFSKATRILIDAMRNRGVRRLICVTGFGAGDSRHSMGPLQSLPFRLLLGRAYDDKDVQESLIKKSDLDWTIVRPGILTNAPRSGRYRVLHEPREWRNGVICRADVADFIVGAIDDKNMIGKEPVLVW